MGPDIHMKTFVWSKHESKYIDAYSLCDNISIMIRKYCYGEFPEIVGERSYELFGLFGNSYDSKLKQLKCLNSGYPDFFKETTLCKVLDTETLAEKFSWCYCKDLRKEISEIQMKRPAKMRDIMQKLRTIGLKLRFYDIDKLTDKSHEAILANVLDLSKTIFVFWFD